MVSLVSLVGLLISVTLVSAVKVQQKTYNQDSCEYTAHSTPATWKDARQKCHDEGGFLITINSEAVRQKIISKIPAGWSYMWSGLHSLDTYNQANTEDVYTWDSGTVATWFSWGHTEPHNRNGSPSQKLNEPVGFLDKTSDWKMGDHNLARTYPYMCEKCQQINVKTVTTPQCNYFYNVTYTRYAEARKVCKDKYNGYLVTVNSPEVKATVIENAPFSDKFWIGLQAESTYSNAALTADTYVWESGTPYTFHDWATNIGAPHNRNGTSAQKLKEPYVFIDVALDGKTDDHNAVFALAFVCETCK